MTDRPISISLNGSRESRESKEYTKIYNSKTLESEISNNKNKTEEKEKELYVIW